MKIKSMYPSLVSKDSKRILEFFYGAGFELESEKKGAFGNNYIEYKLKNEAGDLLEISQSNTVYGKEEQCLIMLVEDFEESLEHFKKHDYKIVEGPETINGIKTCVVKNHTNLIKIEESK